jgi:hypothetical protein
MKIIYDYEICDNLEVLNSFGAVLGLERYHQFIGLWVHKEYTKIIDLFIESGFENTNELKKFLKVVQSELFSLIEDKIIGIFFGLIPTEISDCHRMKYYFIVRCINNGRTMLIM